MDNEVWVKQRRYSLLVSVVFSPVKYSMKEGHQVCKNMGARLPEIRNVIKGYITSKFSTRSDFYRFHSIRQIEDIELKPRFIDFLKSFGLNYSDIYFKKDDESNKKNNYPLDKLFLTKISCHDNSVNVTLNMEDNESEGTKKLFDLAGLLLHAFNIEKSGLIILDEIDSNFHPSLLIKLISMFNDPNINK